MLSLQTFPDPVAVAEALSLVRGGNVRHGLDVLDRTDTPTGEVLRFESGSITWSYRAPDRVVGQSDAVAAVRRRGSLTIPAGQSVNLNAARLRLWSEWQLLDSSWARFYLGVFTVVNPGALTDDGVRLLQTLTLADKSHLWANTLLAEPLYVPAGTAVVEWVKARLAARFGEVTFAIASSSAVLDEPRTFESGLSELEVCSRLLEAVAFDQLTVTENGLPASQPLSVLAGKGPEVTYGAGQGKVVEAGQVEPLLPTLPNVVRFSARQGPSLGNTDGNGLTYRRNQSTGPASIDARGGTGIGEVEITVDVEADSQVVLEQIADADCQRYFAGGGVRWSGDVALNPRAGDRDVIAVQLPRLDMAGVFNVTEWTYPLAPVTSAQAVLMPVTAEMRVGT